jgi:hypothetical protein
LRFLLWTFPSSTNRNESVFEPHDMTWSGRRRDGPPAANQRFLPDWNGCPLTINTARKACDPVRKAGSLCLKERNCSTIRRRCECNHLSTRL